MVAFFRRRPWLSPLGLTAGLVWLAACAGGGELDEGGITPNNGGSGGSDAAGAGGSDGGNAGNSTINGGNGGSGNGGNGGSGNGGSGNGGSGGDVNGGNGGNGGSGNAGTGGTAGDAGTGGVSGSSGSSGSGGVGGSSGSSGSGGSSGSAGSGGSAGSSGSGTGGSGGSGCDNSMAANTCATATDLGGHCADTNCGTLCPVAGAVSVGGSVSGTTSEWFVLEAQECSSCIADLIGEAKLTVPAGVNYDLFLWSSCNTLVASSTNGTGTDESVLGKITGDTVISSDTQDYYLEVRYVGGSSCAAWTLSITGSNC